MSNLKAILPHSFYIFASQFTLDSMIKQISNLSYHIFCNPDSLSKKLAKNMSFRVTINHRVISGRANVVQTWIIDMLYDLVLSDNYGKKTISLDEAVYLVSLYNEYCNSWNQNISKTDILLFVYGLFGEQKDFQTNFSLKERFSREKYILDVLSCKQHKDNIFEIDIQKQFFQITGFTTNHYSSLIYYVVLIFIHKKGIIKEAEIPSICNNTFTQEDILSILNQYSTSTADFRKSNLKRQFLYTKPIIKINKTFIASNAFLMNALFENSNYWILRNEYRRRNSQHFINAFGIYFEMYVEELLSYYLCKKQFHKIIAENNQKRADWIIQIENYTFLVEQKSSLSLLGIKQNQPDIEAMKEHILKTWGKAVKQLSETQTALNLDTAVKIILVYEDYYKSECLGELFRINPNLVNDYNYWLMTINEFEMLLDTYKTDPTVFFEIINNKVKMEHMQSQDGRDIEQLLSRKGISENSYIQKSGIINQYQSVEDAVKSSFAN